MYVIDKLLEYIQIQMQCQVDESLFGVHRRLGNGSVVRLDMFLSEARLTELFLGGTFRASGRTFDSVLFASIQQVKAKKTNSDFLTTPPKQADQH